MARRSWFSIQNAAAADEATVTIFDEIGYWGVNAADFSREFRAITAPIINLEINSPGGSVFDGIAIYNMLKGSGKTINAKVMGIAASIASIILMAADKITMPANAMVMVHSPSGGVFGTAEEMRDMADLLDKVKASLVGTYMKRTGKTEEEIVALLSKDTFMTAAEAKENGFADEVIDAIEISANFDMEALPENMRAMFASKAPAADPAADPVAVAAAAAIAAAAAKPSEPVVPFADQVKALATTAGFEAYAPAWSLAFTTVDAVTARILEAAEIEALCALAGKPDIAAGLIVAGKPLADMRIALQNALADGDKNIDTAKPNSNQPISNAGPSAVTTAGIWAKRNKQTTGV